MRKVLWVSAVVAAMALSACGKEESKKVYSTPEGKMELTRKEKGNIQEFTVKSKDGTATMTMGESSIPDDLGVPIYPEVEKEQGGTWSMSGTGEQGKGGFSSTALFSKDPFDKVAAFYKDKLKGRKPETYEMAMPQGKMLTIAVISDDTHTSVVLSEDKERAGTHIQITKTQK